MPEENASGTGSNKLLAGKYDTPEKLFGAISGGITKLGGNPDPNKIGVGEGKMFKDIQAAEAFYATVESGIGAVSAFKSDTVADSATPDKGNVGKPDNSVESLLSGAAGEINLETASLEDIRKHAGITPELEADMAKRFIETGEISDADFAVLKRAGFSTRAAAKRHVQLEIEAAKSGVTQTVAESKAEAVKLLGGEEQLKTVMQWAAKGGVDRSVVMANDAAIRANPRMYPTIAAGYKAMYEAKNGKDSQPVRGGGSTTGTPSGVVTQTELKALNRRIRQGDTGAAKELQARIKAGGLSLTQM
jgi:hypothetical protein